MPLVLALEPDHRQAAALQRVIVEHVRAELTLVDSRDAALAAIAERMPDVILLTALLSPRDEEELFTRLRSIDGAEYVQTHTIPQLASGAAPEPEDRTGSKSMFGKLRRKKAEPEPMTGCDPALFGEEVLTFIQRAAELKTRGAVQRARIEVGETHSPGPSHRASASESERDPIVEPMAAPSAWSSPFEWRRGADTRSVSAPPAATVEPPVDSQPAAGAEDEYAARQAAERAGAVRRDAEREAERLRQETEAARLRQDAEVERQRLLAEAEQQRADAEAQRQQIEAEAERQRVEVEAAAAREREAERLRVDAERKAERVRVEAEREKERLRVESEREAERVRVETQRQIQAAEREKERLRAEAEAAAARRREAERLHLEAEKDKERVRKLAEEEKERLRAEAERQKIEAQRQKMEAERVRLEAEAAAARQREAERLRQEAEREAERFRLEAERQRAEAERQKTDAQRDAEQLRKEAERQKKEAEAAAVRQREAERLRLEAERETERLRSEADRQRLEAERQKVEAERQKEDALRQAERLRAQAEEDAERARAGEAIANARTQEEARERREAEKTRKRSADRARKHHEAVHDAFADFRDDPIEPPRGAVRLVPLAVWARIEQPPQAAAPVTVPDELRELLKALAIPPHVAGVTYARGCRIRRVRVPALPPGAKGKASKNALILSRKVLDDVRAGRPTA